MSCPVHKHEYDPKPEIVTPDTHFEDAENSYSMSKKDCQIESSCLQYKAVWLKEYKCLMNLYGLKEVICSLFFETWYCDTNLAELGAYASDGKL